MPDIHQTTEISSITIVDVWEPKEEGLDTLETQRRVSVITITLSKEPLDTSHIGYQPPLPADQVSAVICRWGRALRVSTVSCFAQGSAAAEQLPLPARPVERAWRSSTETLQEKSTTCHTHHRHCNPAASKLLCCVALCSALLCCGVCCRCARLTQRSLRHGATGHAGAGEDTGAGENCALTTNTVQSVICNFS